MSHFTKVKTQMVEREFLIRSLRDLGYSCEVGDVRIKGFQGKQSKAEIKVPTNDRGFDIGFRKAGNAYEIVADWWGIRDIQKDEFLQKVTQRYAYHATREKLEEQGFTLVTEAAEADGKIHLVLRRMA